MSTNEEYSTAQSKDKRKAQLSHALIDVDFCDKPKIKALTYKFGQLGPWYLTRLIMAMSRATDAVIDLDAALCIAQEVGLGDRGQEVVDYLVANDLIQLVLNKVSQERVTKDQESLQKRRDDDAERQRLRRDKLRDIGVTPVSVSDPDTGSNDPKKIVSPEPPPGAIKLSEKIYLDPIKYDAARMEFLKFDLEPGFWLPRAAIHVEGWLAKPANQACDTPEQWYYHVVKWGLQECLEDRGKKIRTDNAKAVQKKINPPDNRPKSKSVHEVMAAQGIPMKGVA